MFLEIALFASYMGAAAAALVGLVLWATPARIHMTNSSQVVASVKKRSWIYSSSLESFFIGLAVGPWYVAFAWEDSSPARDIHAWILCSDAFMKNINSRAMPPPGSTTIKVATRKDSRLGRYGTVEIPLVVPNTFVPRPQQKTVSEGIAEVFRARGSVSALVTGPPGGGKTRLSTFIAQAIGADTLIMGFDPTIENGSMISVFNSLHPTVAKPLVVVLDEVDQLFELLKRNLVQRRNDYASAPVSNFAHWNQMLDMFDWENLFPGVVLLMTSNLSRVEICKRYGDAAVRPGRVHFFAEIDETSAKKSV